MQMPEKSRNMHAVILCAGSGRRLQPLTKDKPKCILEIGGKTLLEYAVEALKAHGVLDIWIVSGFREEAVRKLAADRKWKRIHFVTNNRYDCTNTGFSLNLVLNKISSDFILLNGDVLFDPRIITDLLSHPGLNCVVVDDRDELDAEDVKVISSQKRVRKIGKELNPAESLGEAIGINKISWNFSRKLAEIYSRHEKNQELQHFFEKGFDELCCRNGFMNIVLTGYDWIEIDTPEDYKRAVSEIYPRIHMQNRDNG
jgi:choline kinase